MFVILGAYGLLYVLNPGGTVDKVGLFQGLGLMKKFPISYFYLISLVLFFVIFALEKKGGLKGFWDKAKCFLSQNLIVAFMFLVTTGWFILFSTSAWIPPRYTLILLPSLIICVFYALERFVAHDSGNHVPCHGL